MTDLKDLESVPDHVKAAQGGARDDQSVGPERSFEYSWTDPSGKVWAGSFVSCVPTIGQQIDIAKKVANRMQGTGGATLPEDVSNLIYTCAYLEHVLIKRPSWAKDLESLPYVEILNGLAEEAAAHIERFRRPRTG